MPNINFSSNGLNALALFEFTNALTGSTSQFKAREGVRKKITDLWPELSSAKEDKAEEQARRIALVKDNRSFTLTPTEQTAIAEGSVKYLKEATLSDKLKTQAIEIIKLCKVYTWVSKQALEGEEELKEFEHSDESVTIDA